MKYLSPEQVEQIHLEISTLCNAACPMCARNSHGGGVLSTVRLNQWDLNDIRRVFTDELTGLKLVQFCGTHGDPITASYLIETVRYIKNKNIRIEIHTNGSLRSLSWWRELLTLLDNDDMITFGIDGIETNDLYRQNTDIDRILERLKMSCESRCQVQWDYLVFRHNEHEIERSKQIAREYGVDRFRIRKTARFDSTKKFRVMNSEGVVVRYLEPPENVEYRHPDLDKITQLHQLLKTESQLVTYNIECQYQKKNKIYVNSRLEVFPCCYISDENEYQRLNINPETIHMPIERLNLRTHTWSEILNDSYYSTELVDSFTNNKTHTRCVKTCGVVDRERGQSQRVEL
jgi:MoaA/NifB/PqqE/SkfB family radical SAM enzyme